MKTYLQMCKNLTFFINVLVPVTLFSYAYFYYHIPYHVSLFLFLLIYLSASLDFQQYEGRDIIFEIDLLEIKHGLSE